MIADTLERLADYSGSVPGLGRVIEFLGSTDLGSLGIGRHAIDGERIYLLIQEYATKPAAEKKWEAHRAYVDLQIVVSGRESMGYAPVGRLDPAQAYNAEKDVAFYDDGGRPESEILVGAGGFCVFFPTDAHRPGCHAAGESAVRKAVVKLRA